jgi:hypothetical protein
MIRFKFRFILIFFLNIHISNLIYIVYKQTNSWKIVPFFYKKKLKVGFVFFM